MVKSSNPTINMTFGAVNFDYRTERFNRKVDGLVGIMTIEEMKSIFTKQGFAEEKTWAKLLMRDDERKTLFVGNDGFFSLTTDEGKGNGGTCWLNTHIDDTSTDQLLQALKNSNENGDSCGK